MTISIERDKLLNDSINEKVRAIWPIKLLIISTVNLVRLYADFFYEVKPISTLKFSERNTRGTNKFLHV